MKKIEKIEETLKDDTLKLVLSYGSEKKLDAPLGVFKYKEIIPAENSKKNEKGEFISGDSVVVFVRLSNHNEQILIPVKDWMQLNKNDDFASFNLNDAVNLSFSQSKVGIEKFMARMSLDDSDLMPIVSENYSLIDLNATYIKNEIIQGLNYSVTPVIYADLAYESKAKTTI